MGYGYLSRNDPSDSFPVFNQKKNLYRRGLRAEHIRRLEFGKALPLRTYRAGLMTVGRSSARTNEGSSFPPALGEVGKAGCEGRLRARLSAKLLRTGRGTRRLLYPSQAAHPTVTRPVRCVRSASACDIRVNEAVRLKHRNRLKSSLSFPT
jgi:hypothetical protein